AARSVNRWAARAPRSGALCSDADMDRIPQYGGVLIRRGFSDESFERRFDGRELIVFDAKVAQNGFHDRVAVADPIPQLFARLKPSLFGDGFDRDVFEPRALELGREPVRILQLKR